MTGVDLAALRELAQQATPGPWEISESEGIGIVRRWLEDGTIRYGRDVVEWVSAERDAQGEIDAAFIAACDPQTVLALVEAVEAALTFAEFKGAANTKAKWATLDALRDALAPFRQEQP